MLSYQINGKPRKKAGAGGTKDGPLSFRKAKVRKTRSPFAMRVCVRALAAAEGGGVCKGILAAGALLRLVAQNFLSSLSQPIAGEPPQGKSFAVSVQYRIINKEKVGQ